MEVRHQLAEQLMPFWDWDIATGECYWSPAFYEILGYTYKEIEPTYDNWIDHLHPEDIDTTLGRVEAALKNEQVYDVDFRLRCKDGNYKRLRSRGIVVWDENGDPVRMGGTYENVSGLYQQKVLLEYINEELNEKTAQLETTNAQLRQFAYAASHDLREPLRVIQGYAKLIESMDLEIDTEAQSYIDWMVDASRRMSIMIDDLLIYSRLNADDSMFSTVSMHSVFDCAKAGLSQQIGESGAIINSCSNLPAVIGIKSHLQRLLQNLFSNAIKFSDPGRPPNIMLTVEQQNGHTTFAVKDNGIGIKERHYKRIFNIFKKLHPAGKYEGTGMGLAICQQIVEHHGGQIWVESDFGKGSTFYFTLPTGDGDHV